DPELVDLVERYYKAQGMFRIDETEEPLFSDTMMLDLSSVEPSLAGPKRPQDRVPLSGMKEDFNHALVSTEATKGFSLTPDKLKQTGRYQNGKIGRASCRERG